MDTVRLNHLINNPSDATEEDIQLLEEAVLEYPYSQMLHILKAKIAFILTSESKSQDLATAAIYSANRAILKEVIQGNNYLERIEEMAAFQELPIVELTDHPDLESFDIQEDTQENDSSTIFDEVLKNLQKLKALREQFLFLESDESESKPKEEPIEEVTESFKEEPKPEKPKEVKTKKVKKTSKKSKKERIDKIIKKDEELDSKVNAFFISEIEQKKQPIAEQKEIKSTSQEEIIEKFIQEQPSIGTLKKEMEKSSEEITRDLSEKSTKFGDDLVSENLAIILLKQGKKERAVDIYRKLIWKLPQKKAYFAARIEEIKK